MALILNKDLLDESGNTMVQNYEDPQGNIHENPYLIINEITINKLNDHIKIHVLIFKDKQSRLNNKRSVFYDYHMISHDTELYNKYFSINHMEEINIFKASYKYINEEFYTNWKTDEN